MGQVRTAFEKWADAWGYDLSRFQTSGVAYKCDKTHHAFMGFQFGHEIAASAPAPGDAVRPGTVDALPKLSAEVSADASANFSEEATRWLR